MCGLIAILGNMKHGFNQNETKTFTDALYFDAVRGMDATGVCVVNNNGSAEVLKNNVNSLEFIKTSQYDKLMTDSIKNGQILLGHNRKRTIGSDTPQNAHPFVINNKYVFMHNGTINNHKTIADTEVDSEALGELLVLCEGDPEKIKLALQKVHGAYACIWYDSILEKVFFLRNTDRPLFMAELINSGYILSSEVGIMMAAALRNYLKLDKIETVPIDHLMSFDLKLPRDPIKREDISTKKSFPFSQGNMGNAMVTVELSKQRFKGMKKGLVGSFLQFHIDDFQNKNPASSPMASLVSSSDWLVMGTSLELNSPNHLITGYLNNITEVNMKQHWDGSLCSGKVYDCFYDPKSKSIHIRVEDIKRVINEMVVV